MAEQERNRAAAPGGEIPNLPAWTQRAIDMAQVNALEYASGIAHTLGQPALAAGLALLATAGRWPTFCGRAWRWQSVTPESSDYLPPEVHDAVGREGHATPALAITAAARELGRRSLAE